MNEYQAALQKAEDELVQWTKHRDEAIGHIAKLGKTIETLRVMLREEPESIATSIRDLGLADALRKVLQITNDFRSPMELRIILEANGYNTREHSNIMASIHSVLKRLESANEVKSQPGADRGTVYLWLSPLTRALLKESEDRAKYLQEALTERPQYGPNRDAIANLTNEELAAKSKRKP